MTADLAAILAAGEATWPPARAWQQDGWTLRDGAGGGKRVSAATRDDPAADPDLAEAAMRARGETPLFQVRPGQVDLDAELEARGYARLDPTRILACPIDRLTDRPIPRVTAFCIWEPLAIMEEIWEQGGIGPARRAVMVRAETKTAILGRWNEKPAGVAFAAVHEGIAMVHAMEILGHQRRQGVGGWLMRRAAFWARDEGATTMAVFCTEANTGGLALYTSLGLADVGQYHYRQKRVTT
jgi:GNAT superfamily N-acetyltransferase